MSTKNLRLPLKDKTFRFLLLIVVAVISLEIVSLIGLQLPSPYAQITFLIIIVSVGHTVIRKGLKALFRLKLGSINLLMLLAVIGAFYLGDYPEASVVIALFVLGERLEDIGIDNSKSALNSLVKAQPKTALLKSKNEFVEIGSIAIGSTIQVRPGDSIPLDGIITVGETTIDESTITGEPLPRDKRVGDAVYAGTINGNHLIDVQTTSRADDTTLSRIIRLTFEASSNKSKIQLFIQKFSNVYTPSILVLALLLWLVPTVFLHLSSETWLLQALTLLVVACPCALVISTPVAVFAAIGNATAKGALVKGGRYLEELSKVKAVAVDKTRTLTYGKPELTDVIPIGEITRDELLSCASGTELFSTHPLAQAIVSAATLNHVTPHTVSNYEERPGKGAIATCLVCESKEIMIGKMAFIRENSSVPVDVERIVEQLSSEGKTCVLVCFNGTISGVLGLSDVVKKDSKLFLQELEELGVQAVMLTGDSENSASHIAHELGIKRFYSNLLPDQKAMSIETLMREFGNVAMVGDGINDAPSLARSSVGISMAAAGSQAAIEASDVALMNDNLLMIPYLIKLGRAVVQRIRFNTLLAVSIKLLFVCLALAGHGSLILAITADVGVTLFVIAYSLRLNGFE